MKKLLVEKDEDAAAVARRVAAEPEADITLVIPKGAAVGTLVALRHLKREAAAAEKTIVVESVDAGILSRSKAARIEAAHPLLQANRQTRSFSDIIPAEAGREERIIGGEPDAAEVQGREGEREREEKPHPTRFRRRGKPLFIFVAALVLCGGTLWLMSTVFARAKVVINFKKTPWHYEGIALASKTAVKVAVGNDITLPGQVFREKKNLTQLFPASGRARVSEKATAPITIYNAYSSEPQALVATTRFLTPDGKIFRLDRQALVPGAQIKDGKIIPAAVDAMVTADAAGGEYNVGPTPKLAIPGFKGTPKYGGFYGELKNGASGGFVGEKATPTENDIAAAKKRTTEVLEAALASATLALPPEITVPAGASEARVTRLVVNKSTDANGAFGVFGEAELRAVGFREADLTAVLLGIAEEQYPDTAFRDLQVSYSGVRANFDGGRLNFRVAATGTLASAFDPGVFTRTVAGQSVEQVRSLLAALPGLADAKIALWPFWLWRLPVATERVEIVTP